MRIAVFSFVLLAAGSAHGQSFLFRHTDTTTPGTGWAVQGIGDVDGDNFVEVALSSYRFDCGFAGCGSGPSKVALLSGASHAVLWEYPSPSFDGAGVALDVIGDVDGDGKSDVLIGAPDVGFPFSIGEARILSSASGVVVRSLQSPGSPNDDFGSSVAGLGDLDGDVVPDVAVASYSQAYVMSSGTGNVLLTIAPLTAFPITTVVARYGDYDLDGKSDVLVGQPCGDGVTSGSVRIYSGATGAVLKAFVPSNLRPTFGWAIAATSDFDGDGRPDVIVGSPEIDFGTGSGTGVVELLGTGSGAALRTFVGTQTGGHLGLAVAGGRDFDGDGISDIAAAAACEGGAPACTRRALVWSGATGLELLDATSTATGDFGVSVDFIGDLTGNGVSDFAFGSPCSTPFADCGEVRFYSDAVGPTHTYCTAGTSSNGCVPAIGFSGVASASAATGFTLLANNVEGQRQGIFFYGISGQQTQPWGGGSTSLLCVKSPAQRMTPHSSGGTNTQCNGVLAQDWNSYMATHPTALGSPRFAGQTFDAQAWYRDPPAAKGTNLTNGLHFTLVP